MTLHYFQIDRLKPHQEDRLKLIFQETSAPPAGARRGSSKGGHDNGERGKFTPAVVEQLASEHETVDEFIAALEARLL